MNRKRTTRVPVLLLLSSGAAAVFGALGVQGGCGTQARSNAASSDAGGVTTNEGGGGGPTADATVTNPLDGGNGPSDATTADATPNDSGPPPNDAGATPARCNGSIHSVGTAPGALPPTPAITVPTGFTLETIAAIGQARELAALPNGDLLVATSGSSVYLVPNAESATPNAPIIFATINDTPVQGVAFYAPTCTVGIASQHGLYTLPYADGQTAGDAGAPVMGFRAGPTANSVDASVDTDTHKTSSVSFSAGKAYVGVGSSCNACVEVDPTRATILQANLDGSAVTTKATRFRNAIALAVNPATGTVWAGGAGQDSLAVGHPYEFFDALTLHAGLADYGWPDCEEDRHAYVTGANCGNVVEPLIELPAYSTIIGGAFYPMGSSLPYAFPSSYGGGVFLTAHGSWHTNADGTFHTPPRVVFVPMNGDEPTTPTNWSDPTAQWTEFIGGFQLADGTSRVGRPTGVAVGAQGSLFVADDYSGSVYRIRPAP